MFFVDDADLVEIVRSTVETVQEVAGLMQGSLMAWEGGLRATGVAIVPEKTQRYLIDFVWTDGQWKYASMEETEAGLVVRDCGGNMKMIERLSASDVYKRQF